MRSLLFNHIIADVKNVNKKHANNKVSALSVAAREATRLLRS